MGWATPYIEDLKHGREISFRPRGNSMAGLIKSGQLCKVAPLTVFSCLSKGDIVLCKVKGRHYLHKITAVKGDRFQIGNNRGGINGWITRSSIYGKYIK